MQEIIPQKYVFSKENIEEKLGQRPKDPQEVIDLNNFKAVLGRKLESWGLNNNELAVLKFIFKRTILWGKTSEVVPIKHIVKGFYNRDRELITPSANVSDKTARRIVNKLIRLGALKADLVITKNLLTTRLLCINFLWEPEEMLNRSKKKKSEIELSQEEEARNTLNRFKQKKDKQNTLYSDDGQIYRSNSGHGDLSNCGQNDLLNKSKRSNKNHKQNQGASHAENGKKDLKSVIENLEKTYKQSKSEKDKQSREKFKKDPLKANAYNLKEIFDSASKKAFDEYIPSPWTVKQMGMAKKFIRSLVNASVDDPVGLVEWSCLNWRGVMNAKFKKYAERPEYPVLEFLIKCKDKFIECRMNEDRMRLDASATRKDKAIRRLVFSGASLEDAIEEVENIDIYFQEKFKLAELEENKRRIKQGIKITTDSSMSKLKYQMSQISRLKKQIESLAKENKGNEKLVKIVNNSDLDSMIDQSVAEFEKAMSELGNYEDGE